MAFRKNNYRRRSTYRKGKGKSSSWSWAGVAKKALQTAKFVASIVNAEKKYFDASVSWSPSTSPAISSLTLMAQGATQSTRNGLSIKAKSLYMKGSVSLNAASSASRVRMIVFIDKECNGALPTGNDILQSAGNVDSPLNMSEIGRFSILRDKTYNLATNQRTLLNYKYFMKFNHHVRYTDGAATSASLQRGNVFLLLMSDQTVNLPTVIGQTRFQYYDN